VLVWLGDLLIKKTADSGKRAFAEQAISSSVFREAPAVPNRRHLSGRCKTQQNLLEGSFRHTARLVNLVNADRPTLMSPGSRGKRSSPSCPRIAMNGSEQIDIWL